MVAVRKAGRCVRTGTGMDRIDAWPRTGRPVRSRRRGVSSSRATCRPATPPRRRPRTRSAVATPLVRRRGLAQLTDRRPSSCRTCSSAGSILLRLFVRNFCCAARSLAAVCISRASSQQATDRGDRGCAPTLAHAAAYAASLPCYTYDHIHRKMYHSC